jgi:predicted phage terminase large subunit-like protein
MSAGNDRRAALLALAAALEEENALREQLAALKAEKARREQETAAIQTFSVFVRLMWGVVEPKDLEWSWHMQLICDRLQDVAEGRCKRLIINIPPGFSKSLLTSVFYPAWRWLRWPSDRSLYLSHSMPLVSRDSDRFRQLIKSEEYQAIVKRLSKPWKIRIDQVELCANTAGGRRECSTLGSGNTGKRADNMFIDDAHDAKEAIEGSPERIAERMMETNQNFDQTLRSRLNDLRTDPVAMIGQRLHEGDISGHCMKQRDDNGNPLWETLILPMRYDPEIADSRDPRRNPGELLDPIRFPDSVVREMEKALGPQASGQYGQRPVAATGGLFPVAQWRFVDHRSFPRQYEREAAGWDLAFGGSNSGAYHAGVFGGKSAGNVYIYAVIRLRCEADVLATEMLSVRQRFPKATAWNLEDAASARPVVATLRSRIPGMVLISPEGDKVARAQSWQPYVASGNVILPCTCGRADPHHHEVAASALPADPWVHDFVAEHASFPKGTLKDQVDAASYLVKPMFEDSANQFQAPNTNAIRSAFRMR